MNVNFEPIIRGLKSDIFEVYNPFHICRIQLQKWGKTMCDNIIDSSQPYNEVLRQIYIEVNVFLSLIGFKILDQ